MLETSRKQKPHGSQALAIEAKASGIFAATCNDT